MKTRIPLFLAAVALSIVLRPGPLRAQGTAFTYQGRLVDNGLHANGGYDFTFAIFDAAAAGNKLGTTLTNTAVVVSNGLFTLPLDFGAGVFSGPARWLEISERASGVGAFSTLSPRQALTASPYAIAAATLTGELPASQVTGTLAVGLIPNLDASKITSGTFTGNGGGLTNVPGALPLQVVAGTTQTAQANTSYLLTNTAQTTITLPASPNVGDIVAVSGAGANGWQVDWSVTQTITVGATNWMAQTNSPAANWSAVASSADGSRLAAVVNGGGIFSSTSSGVTWTAQAGAPSTNWSAIASSADGTHLVAVVSATVTSIPGPPPFFFPTLVTTEGQIYTSANSGVTWTAQAGAPSANWSAVASSSDGTQLAAVVNGGGIYTSTNSGVTWTAQTNALSASWSAVASSADGTQLVAVVNGGGIYTSTNSGVTWTAQAGSPSTNWFAVASSSDGTRLVVVDNGGDIYTSTNSGVTWTDQTNAPSAMWDAVASSADGTQLVAVIAASVTTIPGGPPFFLPTLVTTEGQIYTSTNSGVTWTAQTNAPSASWSAVASSADGFKLVATVAAGQIYTGYAQANLDFTQTTQESLAGSAGQAVTLQYIGNGVWQPVAQQITASQITSGVFTGNGGGLTGLNPTNLSVGTAAINISGNAATATSATSATSATTAANVTGNISDAQLSANVALLEGTNSFTATNQFSGVTIATNAGNLLAGAFTGDGSGLTNLALSGLQLAPLTNNQGGVTLTGSFTGDGGGLTNVALSNGTNWLAGVTLATNVNNVLVGAFTGNGGGLTNLNAAGLTNSVADARLSANVAFLSGTNVFTATNRFAGVTLATNVNNVLVGAFTGNGGGLTNLNASGLTNTLADARLSANVAFLGGTNVFTATNRFAGVTLATNVNNVLVGAFTGNGGGLTNLNAAGVTNTLADARLSANVAFLSGTNVFTATNRFAGVTLATNVNNVLVGAFTGNGSGLTNLALSGLQAAPLTNNQSSVTLTGSFTGNGAGLTNTITAANYAYAYDASTQTTATSNTFQDVTFGATLQTNGWSHFSGSAAFTCAQSGLYLIQYTAVSQFTSGSAPQTNSMIINRNGAIQTDWPSAAILSSLNTPVSMSKTLILSASANDIFKLRMAGSSTNVQLTPVTSVGNTQPSVSLTIIRIQ